MLIYGVHIGSALSIWLACCIVFLWKERHGFWAYFLLGWTLQVGLSLSAGLWQALQGWPHIDVSGSPLWARCLTPLVGWPFNTGGYTVRWVFEATVGPMEPLVLGRNIEPVCVCRAPNASRAPNVSERIGMRYVKQR